MGTLSKLIVHHFRKVKPETTLELVEGFNVVLGRNATGKTTLLDLAAAADAFDFSRFSGERFDVSWEREGVEGRSRTRVTNEVEVESIELPNGGRLRDRRQTTTTVDLRVDPAGEVPYRIELSRDTASLFDGDVEVRTESRSSRLPVEVEAYSLAQHLASRRRLLALPSMHSPAVRLDESIEHLSAVTADDVAVYANGEAMVPLLFPDALSLDLLQGAGTRPSRERLRLDSTSSAFLATLAKELGFESATLICDLIEGRPDLDRYGNLRLLFTDAFGQTITHQLLSYGQKRLLSALWYFEARRGLLACDELVNGLHHEWIARALERISGRQALLTSQNPLLLDYLSFDSAEEVRRSFVVCERSGAELVWRNFSQEEADDFFGAYRVGIQRVSDILIMRGLW